MHLSNNLRFLRTRNTRKKSQEVIADKLGITRGAYSSYEEGRAEPRLDTLVAMANYFEVTVDELLNENLEERKFRQRVNTPYWSAYHRLQVGNYVAGTNVRVLAISVDELNNENIELVPQKAAAGYAKGYADLEYIKELPKFKLPFLPAERTYRSFEISGDSMLPLESGTIVIGEYVADWNDLKEGEFCVLVAQDEGIVFKRVHNQVKEKGTFLLESTNLQYRPYELPARQVKEIWKFAAYISKKTPEAETSLDEIKQVLNQLQKKLGVIAPK
ncbi:XRE family transcriptional regulator [Hugenholtzia roseola]|uniref:XRE family transcriptional regulator n=1 Tax=Hugenholtzia roseola TaxID=1002 RepID=UPI00047A7730|nr:helix-turn-helix domain-containing protein [Hugenholtzia roseola]